MVLSICKMKFASALALFATATFPSVFAAFITVNVGLRGNTFTVCITAFPICFVLIAPVIALEYNGGGWRRHLVQLCRRKPRTCPLLDILMAPT